MFYVSSINGSSVGVTDTYDNVEEFYSPSQIKEISKNIKIKGVSSKGIKKIDLGKVLLTRDIVEKIDCEKELSFEIVDDSNKLAKYRLLGGKVINDNFMTVETDTNIKLVSDKVIMLDNSIYAFMGIWKGLFNDTSFTKIDFHNTNTSNVENMNNMFSDCQATSLNLSNFDTSNVKSMEFMFSGCHATSLDLSNFDTSNVENMYGMFQDCQAISLDLSNFDTFNVESMTDMFLNCRATPIDLSSFDTSNAKFITTMFENYEGIIKSTDVKILQAYNSRRIK